jgi:L-rhamnose-H+ transport protein
MLISAAILPILLAGIMNGSFVIPTRYIKNINSEKIWLFHSLIGLAIIPWLLLLLVSPTAFQYYPLLQSNTWVFLIMGGAIFGIGQVCFAYAIAFIGVALSFAVNLGIGVTIGSLFVVFYQHEFFTSSGYRVSLAVLLIISSLIVSYYASRNKQNLHHITHNYHMGWILAIVAGIASGFQNITFVMVAFHTQTQFQANNSFWVWPPFLLAAAIPMMIGFIYRIRQNRANSSFNIKGILAVIIMGLLFTGSLALYSRGMSSLSLTEQVLGWPILMVSIILVSQGWGLFYGEAQNNTKRGKLLRFFSLTLLILAIILLSLK